MSLSNGLDPAISVVVPVRNEAGNIAPLVAEIAAALQGRDFEIVYVDDGSQDDYRAGIARTDGAAPVASANPARAIVRTIGRGAHRCCDGARACRGDARWRRSERSGIHPGADCSGLKRAGRDTGWSRVNASGRKATGFKKLQSRIANAVRSAVLKDGTRDTGCGLKAFRRDVFLALPYFDGLHRFMPALIRRDGFDIGYVDVVDRDRRHGTSNYGFLGPVVDRHSRSWRGVVAHSAQEARCRTLRR